MLLDTHTNPGTMLQCGRELHKGVNTRRPLAAILGAMGREEKVEGRVGREP